jgi:predicted GIY-YIG superfamily endonuclease
MSWYCYVLETLDDNKTIYVGMTNNLKQRIRRHCGQISGGAKATQGKQHRFLFYVSGFPTKIHALRFEWAMKNPNGPRKWKKPGAIGKYEAVLNITNRDRWTSKSDPASETPLTIHWCNNCDFWKENKEKFPVYIFHDMNGLITVPAKKIRIVEQ